MHALKQGNNIIKCLIILVEIFDYCSNLKVINIIIIQFANLIMHFSIEDWMVPSWIKVTLIRLNRDVINILERWTQS